jgi:hypothetical protein
MGSAPVEKLITQPVETRMTAHAQANMPINKPCERASFSAVIRHCASSSGVRWTHIGERDKDGGRKMEIQQKRSEQNKRWQTNGGRRMEQAKIIDGMIMGRACSGVRWLD